ncbi:MAG: VanZ family protein [Acidimicrobiales bacterium]
MPESTETVERSPSSPFGPGGRPLGGIRPYLVGALAIATLVLVPVMFAERAPDLARAIGRWIEDGDGLVGWVDDTLWIPRSPFAIHIVAWGVVAGFAGLIAWSWRSLQVFAAAAFGLSLVVEMAQEWLTDTRHSQLDDAIANGIGVVIGVGLAIAANVVWRRLATGRFLPDHGDEGDHT